MGLIHLYNSIDDTHETFNANGKIKDILPDIDFSKSIIIREGFRLDPETAEIKENDIIYIRNTPGSTAVLATIAIVTSVIAVGVGVGIGIYANKMSQEAKEKLEKAQRDAETLANSIESLPFLKGAKNQTALGNAIQYLIGEMYNTPYQLTDGYFTIGGNNGSKQYWTTTLCLGYGPQIIKSVSIGTSKILSLNDTTPQSSKYTFDKDSVYYDPENTIEVMQNNNLSAAIFKRKVISVQDGTQIKHNYGEESEPVIKQMSANTKEIELCIQFNGLRQYNNNTSAWEQRTLTVKPSWSNDNGQTWNEFYFNFPASACWTECTNAEIDQAVTNGKIQKIENGAVTYWIITDNNYKFIGQKINDKETVTEGSYYPSVLRFSPGEATNTISMNSRNTMRFTANKVFTWNETHDSDGNALDLMFKVEKVQPNKESNSNEDVYLLYYNSYCYDAQKSNATDGLVDCVPMEYRFVQNCTLMGIRIIANDSTIDTLEEINVVAQGVARTWNSTTRRWSTTKKATRNPAAWLLEVLTSDIHKHSKYNDSELDLPSFGALYEYCEENEFLCDNLITQATKKEDIISGILKTVGADLIIDNLTGKRSIVIDKKEDTPVALLNAQCITSVTTAKSFERKPSGMKVTFTNHDSWAVDTFYCMRDGTDTYDVTDTLTELAIEYATTHAHAYKIAQRQMRQTFLQPRTLKVKVGKEGDFYPLYSTVKLQLEQLKIGIRSSVIHKLGVNNTNIMYIDIADSVVFETGKRYGVILQCESSTGRNLLTAEVLGSGKTNRLEFATPLDTTQLTEVPHSYNTLSFGELNADGTFDKVTNVMKITAISGDDSGIELTLKDYNEDIYEYGDIPEYRSNLTSTPNSSKSKVNDIDIASYKRDIQEAIEKDIHVEAQPIVQITDLNDTAGAFDGTIGIYEDKFYKVERNAWVAIESDNYLGILSAVPEVASMGSFFLVKEDISKRKLLKIGNKTLAVSVDGETVNFCLENKLNKNKLYELTVNGWQQIADEKDYRYIIAMSDVVANGGTLPFYISNGVADSTPKYLGASSTAPESANKGDWFTCTGEEVAVLSDDEEADTETEDTTTFEKGKVYTYENNSSGELEWKEDTSSAHKVQALDDLLEIADPEDDTSFTNVFINKLVTNEAFIEKLVTKYVELKDGGYIKSSNYDATNPNTKGMCIDTYGNATFRGDVYINGNTTLENALLKNSVNMISFSKQSNIYSTIASSSFNEIADLFNLLNTHIPFMNNKSTINANISVYISAKSDINGQWTSGTTQSTIVKIQRDNFVNGEYTYYKLTISGITLCKNNTSGETRIGGNFELTYSKDNYIAFKNDFTNYAPGGKLNYDGSIVTNWEYNSSEFDLSIYIDF